MPKIPNLTDLIRLWLKEEKTGYAVESCGDESTYRIISGLTNYIAGWIFLGSRPNVGLYDEQRGVVGAILCPEDPEFFNKLRSALGMKNV